MGTTKKIIELSIVIAALLCICQGKAHCAGTLIALSSMTYSSPFNTHDNAYGVALDPSGNIIVTGSGFGDYSGTYDYFTIKYNANFVVMSSAAYNGPGNGDDRAYAVAVDSSGNIIVTGSIFSGGNDHIFTIKYDANLVAITSAAYDSGGADYGYGVAVDKSGNIIVCGSSSGKYCTIKYDANLVMISSAANFSGQAFVVAADPSGNIIVTGRIPNGLSSDWFTVKYDKNLTVLSSAQYNGPANAGDKAYGMAVDGSGNIIVAGYSFNGSYDDLITIKYDGNLVVLTSATLNGSSGSDETFRSVAADATGNIYVAGNRAGDYLTVKYSPNFVLLSSATYNGPGNNLDVACGLAVDASGNIIVAGTVYSGSNYDYFTIKYNGLPPAVTAVSPATGKQGTTQNVVITGSNFLPGAAVSFGGSGVTVNSVTRDSASQLTAGITIATDIVSGSRDVTVTNLDAVTGAKTKAFLVGTFAGGTAAGATSGGQATIIPESGKITVDIAIGTFKEPVTITLTTATAPSTSVGVKNLTGICFEVTNDKSLQPDRPVTVMVYYRDSDIPGLDEARLSLARYGGGRWFPVPTVVNAGLNMLVSTIDHFSTFAVVETAAADLAGVKVYPNPFNPKQSGLTITNLTGEAEIRIYTVAGELVRTLPYTSANGQAAWDGKNDGGNQVVSGVYLVFIKSPQGKKIIKIAVER